LLEKSEQVKVLDEAHLTLSNNQQLAVAIFAVHNFKLQKKKHHIWSAGPGCGKSRIIFSIMLATKHMSQSLKNFIVVFADLRF